MLHFWHFFHNRDSQKNAHKPLQGLGLSNVTHLHKMLHQCNIFNENYLKHTIKLK